MSNLAKAAIIFWSILVILLGIIIQISYGEGQLSELQKLKAQNFQLKAQLTQCQVQFSQSSLTGEQAQLVEEFRKTLSAPAGATFDWSTLTFKEAAK